MEMVVLGILLAILGYFIAVPILETLGLILVVVGLILWLLGAAGHPVGGRARWY